MQFYIILYGIYLCHFLIGYLGQCVIPWRRYGKITEEIFFSRFLVQMQICVNEKKCSVSICQFHHEEKCGKWRGNFRHYPSVAIQRMFILWLFNGPFFLCSWMKSYQYQTGDIRKRKKLYFMSVMYSLVVDLICIEKNIILYSWYF